MRTEKATLPGGILTDIPNTYLFIPGPSRKSGSGGSRQRAITIRFKILPEITDGKRTSFIGEPIQGRTSPLKTYSHSEERIVNITMHFILAGEDDAELHLEYLRWIQSAVYPRERENFLYLPPPVCEFKCGALLGEEPLTIVLQSYNVKYPVNVAWEPVYHIPMKFSIDTTWETVYRSDELPGQERIINWGN